jgi:Spx/MgsR family transcriptional regulator
MMPVQTDIESETVMAITLYGIPNCDTVRKARIWLDGAGIGYAFHDYKKAGIDAARLKRWCKALGWETVLNRAGTTFRKLPDAKKAVLTEAKAIELMLAEPSMIKRPVVEHSGGLLIGFKPDDWTAALR